ncbi:MAG: hypothetical protein U5K30_14320 [Acidimicrobiales bacterium]|nr:hypothetical protein [Acidimicrobiales bacterium]
MDPLTIVLIAVGAVVFALIVYGAVNIGGLEFTKKTLQEEEQFQRRVDDDQLDRELPTDAKF